MLPEYAEMLSALSAARARYLVVGGYAVGAHVEPRATKDIDIFVEPTLANARRILSALKHFGAPLFGLTVKELATPGLVFQIGVPPRRIDILTSITGVDFKTAWRSRLDVNVAGVGDKVHVLGRDALIANKRAVGRPQDAVDVLSLEASPSRPRRSRRR